MPSDSPPAGARTRSWTRSFRSRHKGVGPRTIRYATESKLSLAITYEHAIRDPIHHWIGFTDEERKVIDSPPVQRLRQIHQLAMTSLVYPAASHMRFEHSLGVMQMASQIYDVVTDNKHVTDELRELVPEIRDPQKVIHWRSIVRMGALCHDVGHLPFSHAAEADLLPPGWTHERLSYELIMSPDMKVVWDSLDPYLRPELVAKLAVGAKEMKFAPETSFSTWEALLSEIIVGDFFGADRMDYLLRDAYHAGVAYGHFDHFRIIDTLRLLPSPPIGGEDEQRLREPALGIELGGLQAAESMMLARFFMFSQVYYHPARIIYDQHLLDFLKVWLPAGKFPITTNEHLALTDNEVMVGLLAANRDPASPAHDAAAAILQRKHYRVFYEPPPGDMEYELPALQVYRAACDHFGEDKLRHGSRRVKVSAIDYPVLLRDNKVASASSLTVVKLEPRTYEYAYIHPDLRIEVREWLSQNHDAVLTKKKGDPQ